MENPFSMVLESMRDLSYVLIRGISPKKTLDYPHPVKSSDEKQK